MPSRKFALEKGQKKRLKISWGFMWKNIVIEQDDREIGTIPGKKEMEQGREFKLDDGSILKVQLVMTLFYPQLKIYRNGKPLPGSDADPIHTLMYAYGIIFFVGILNIIVGIIAEVGRIKFLSDMGLGIGSIIFGFVFLLLGALVKRRSKVALAVAIVLFIIDGILSIALIVNDGGTPPIPGLIIRIVLLIPMFQGFLAINELNKKETKRT